MLRDDGGSCSSQIILFILVKMAVLKSPRNSRNKSNWTFRHKLRKSENFRLLTSRRVLRVKHNFQRFLLDYAYKKIKSSDVFSFEMFLPEYVEGFEPRKYISYGNRFFNMWSLNPLLLQEYLIIKKHNQRYLLLLNNACLIRQRKLVRADQKGN